MTVDDGPVAAYLERIGHREPGTGTVGCLARLHERHLRAVPFENLDVVAGRRLRYGLDEIVDKIVTRRRGGWCLETNWLLGHVLTRLGYRVRFLGAGVATGDGFKNDLSHLLLLVGTPDGPQLADVGFGHGGYAEPLPARPGRHDQATGSYLVERDSGYLVVSRVSGGQRMPLYRCSSGSRRIADFAATSAFHELSPDSPFNATVHCSRLTDDGWAVLRGDHLLLRSDRLRHSTVGTGQRAAVLDWILRDAPPPQLDWHDPAGDHPTGGPPDTADPSQGEPCRQLLTT